MAGIVTELATHGWRQDDDSIVQYSKQKYNLQLANEPQVSSSILAPLLHMSSCHSWKSRGAIKLVATQRFCWSMTKKSASVLKKSTIISSTQFGLCWSKPHQNWQPDIIEKGIVLAGGGSLLHGMDVPFANEQDCPSSTPRILWMQSREPVQCLIRWKLLASIALD